MGGNPIAPQKLTIMNQVHYYWTASKVLPVCQFIYFAGSVNIVAELDAMNKNIRSARKSIKIFTRQLSLGNNYYCKIKYIDSVGQEKITFTFEKERILTLQQWKYKHTLQTKE